MMNYKTNSAPKRYRPAFCRLCGSAIPREELAMIFSGKAICESCISEISAREILRICEFNSKKELLYSLGFEII